MEKFLIYKLLLKKRRDNNSSSIELKNISPTLCRQGILYHFEELANRLSAGWKYHVANTDGIKDAWMRFEEYYNSVCSFIQGWKYYKIIFLYFYL